VIPVGRNSLRGYDGSSYHDVGKKMAAMNATIPMNAQIIGKNNKPLWKVSIIPDVDAPTERFALAFSMSHMLADAHSYYKIFSMLDQDSRVEALQPMRNQSFQQQLLAHTGKDEADFVYLHKVLERQPPPPEPRQWWQPQPQAQAKNNTRRQRNPLAESRINKDKVVFKMFFVNEDWLLQRKSGAHGQGPRQGRRSSVYDFVQLPTADGAAEVKATTTPAAACVSANSIITSWFFNDVTKPALALMAANMRNRLDGIGENDMGNYVHTILYTPVDYKTPALIQESLTHMRRCGSDPISALPDLWEMNKLPGKQPPPPPAAAADKPQSNADETTTREEEAAPLLLIPPAGVAKNDGSNILSSFISSDAALDTACSVLELLDCGDGTAAAATTTTTTTRTPPPKPATLTSSISINWARYCPEREIYLVPDLDDSDHGKDDGDAKADDNDNAAGTDANSSVAATTTEKDVNNNTDNGGTIITQTLHIPIFTFQELEFFPDTLSAIAIFTASPRGQHSPERRPGAWLICKESTWLSEIKSCGIVEEMIAEMNL
jgi:hypothetical protein